MKKTITPSTSSCWDGTHYSNNSEWQFHMATVALGYIHIPTDAKILDVGCGDGKFTKYLAGLIPDGKILGIDPSPSMLASAQDNILSNLSFLSGNAVRLPYKNHFDRIVAFNSLHWVPEITVALEQIREALTKNGQVLILVAPIQVRHPLHKIINEVAQRECWHSYFENTSNIFSFYTLVEWATLIEKAKMIPETLTLVDASMKYATKKKFANSLIGWVPFGTIPHNKRNEYVADIVESYIKMIPCDSNGAINYLIDELIIVASKP